MKRTAQLLVGLAVLGSAPLLLGQAADSGARPAATSKFSLNRLRCAIFNKRHLTLVRGEKRELNMPNAIAGLSKDPSVVRASLEFGTLSVEGIALGKTQVVVLGSGQERQVIVVQVVDPAKFDPARQEVKAGAPEKTPVNADPALKPNPEEIASARPRVEEHATLGAPLNTPSEPAAVLSFPSRVPEAPSVTTSGAPQPSGASNGEMKGDGANLVPAAATPAGDSVTLVELTEVVVAVDDVRAAYSLDPLIAEAQMADDHVRIWGRSPGQAMVVLVMRRACRMGTRWRISRRSAFQLRKVSFRRFLLRCLQSGP